MASAAELKVVLSAVDAMTPELKKAQSSLADLDKSAKATGTTFAGLGEGISKLTTGAAVAGVAGLAVGLGVAVNAAADFEHAISGIVAVSGAGADEIEGLRSTALQLGADTKFSATEAAVGMEELIKAGVSMTDVMGGGARAALDLAAAGELEVAEAAEITANALNVFGRSGSEAAHISDVIAGAANASAIDVHDFGMSMAAAGSVSDLMGISFEDTAAAIAVMGQAGIKGSDAGTSLKTMFLNLIPSTDTAADKMKELGFITADGTNRFIDQEGKVKDLATVSAILQGALVGMGEAEQAAALKIAFGNDAVRAAAILSKAGAEGFTEMADAMAKVSAQDVAEERLNNLQGSLEKMKGSLETAAVIIGTAFLPVLKDMTDAITQLVNDNMPAIQEAARGTGEAFRAAVPILAQFFTILVENRETIGIIVAALATLAILVTVTGWINATVLAFTGLWATLSGAAGIIAGVVAVLGGPLTLAIAAVVAALALLTLAWTQNWGDIQGITATAIAAVQGFIQTGLDAIAAFWDAHGQTIIAAATTIWAAIQAAVDAGIKAVQTVIAAVTAAITGDWQTFWELLGGLVQEGWNAIVRIAESEGPHLVAIFERVVKAITDAFSPANLNAINDNLTTALNNAGAEATKKAGELGPMIVGGIVEGIKRYGSNPIQAALSGLITAAVERVRQNPLEAGSPSRYTAEQIGVPMGQGVVEGFVTTLSSGQGAMAEAIRAIVTTAVKYGIDPTIALALAKAESGFNPAAVGDKGASVGLFQLHSAGQGAGMSVAQRSDPWINAEKFLSQHGALFQALAGNYSGSELAARFGVKAERPLDQSGAVYAAAWRELTGVLGDVTTASVKASGAVSKASEEAVAASDAMAQQQADAAAQAAHLAEVQTGLNETIGKGFPQSAAAGTQELKAFSVGAQILTDKLLAGQIGIDDAALGMVRYAASTGLSISPMQQMEAGLIGQDQALAQVLADATMVNPAYANIAAGLIMGATSATTATLDFLQLAASTQGMTDAVVPAQAAFAAFGASLPALGELINAGAVTGDEFTKVLIGLSNSSGLVKSSLDVASASTSELNAEFARIVDELAITDPSFQGLNDTLQKGAPLTDEQRIEMVKLIGIISGVPTAYTPAITANQNLGTATGTMASDSTSAWQGMLDEIRTAVKSIDETVKKLAEAVIGYIKNIDSAKAEVHVETNTAVKQLNKLEDAAEDALDALEDLPSKAMSWDRKAFGIGGWATGGIVPGPQGAPVLGFVHGGEMVLTPQQQASMLTGSGGGGSGGGTIVINVNAPVYGVNDLETVVVSALDRANRRGRSA